jgi:hypothetical protein
MESRSLTGELAYPDGGAPLYAGVQMPLKLPWSTPLTKTPWLRSEMIVPWASFLYYKTYPYVAMSVDELEMCCCCENGREDWR